MEYLLVALAALVLVGTIGGVWRWYRFSENRAGAHAAAEQHQDLDEGLESNRTPGDHGRVEEPPAGLWRDTLAPAPAAVPPVFVPELSSDTPMATPVRGSQTIRFSRALWGYRRDQVHATVDYLTRALTQCRCHDDSARASRPAGETEHFGPPRASQVPSQPSTGNEH